MLRLSLKTRRSLLPYLFLGPGLLWLIIFYAIPLVNQAGVSLMTGNPEDGYTLQWHFATYTNAISDYSTQFGRSILFAGIATILCLVIGFPLAYFIAYKAGRWKNFMLLLVILPFFTSYVLRTDPEIANNPLIFPPDDVRARLHAYPALSPADERAMQSAMADVTGA